MRATIKISGEAPEQNFVALSSLCMYTRYYAKQWRLFANSGSTTVQSSIFFRDPTQQVRLGEDWHITDGEYYLLDPARLDSIEFDVDI